MELILNITVVTHLFIFFCMLFFGKKSSTPNKILALILINPGINFISNTLILTGHFASFPYLFFLGQMSALLFAPLVYIYTNLLIGEKINKKHPMYLATLITIAISGSFAIEFMVIMSPEEQSNYLYGLQNEPYPWQQDLINTIFIILQQIYFTLAAINIYNYKKRVTNQLSNFSKTKLSYISRFIILIWILNLITIVLYVTLPMTFVEYIGLPSVLIVIYIFILFYAYYYNSVFTPEAYEQFLTDNAPVTEKNLYDYVSNTPVQKDELEIIANKIQRLLEDEEPFTNSDLTLDMLAKMVKIPGNKVSAAINKVMKKTFFDLINEKRVEKAKIILKEKHDKLTIQAIAEEAGFSSRASFYRAFRKYTDITPVEFLKQQELA